MTYDARDPITALIEEGKLLWASPSGRAVKPPSADVGSCDRCGCGLSRYREVDESTCWACSHVAHAALSATERGQRLILLASGQEPLLSPHPDFVCPKCHGIKSAGALTCAGCHFKAPHPKKPLSRALKSGPCPACGGPKNAKARLCRTCWALDQQLLFAGNPAVTCPDCGGPKVRKAERCRQCRERVLFGTVYRDGRPLHLTCPHCGGPKRLARAKRCRDCALVVRRREADRRHAEVTA